MEFNRSELLSTVYETLAKDLNFDQYDKVDLSISENIEYQKAAEMYFYYCLNLKYLNLPDNQEVAVGNYLELCKIGRRNLPLSDVAAVSTDTVGYLIALQCSLLENDMSIFEENPDKKLILGSKSSNDWYVSYDKLRDYIDRTRREKLTIGERLEEDLKAENAGSDVGMVKLKPFYQAKNKLSGLTVEDPNGQMWSVEDMKKLAADLLAAAKIKEQQKTKK